MRQRVGFARAMVVDPVLLLMDEPFSALDVLTAETLRTDFLDLWIERQLPIRSVLMVTHNIEEAVLMCDRILILSANPGRIAAELPVTLPHPRNRLDEAFHGIVDEIYSILTTRSPTQPGGQSASMGGLAQRLPSASVNQMSGLIETIMRPPMSGQAAMAKLARALATHSDELFHIAEALHILEFAEVVDGALKVTAAGRVFAQCGTDERKRLFAEHLLRFVPLAAHIRHVLDEREGHWAPRVRFEPELEDRLTRHDAEATLRTVIGWGRYAELFSYDDRTRRFAIHGSAT
jgi:NitT/TauT family transport system ATP-binding protein